MPKPLDEVYLKWLYAQIASSRERDPSKTHWELARLLYTTEFVWFIPNDDNRIEDGLNLRDEFLLAKGTRRVDSSWMDLGCSFLELLIGLARRLSFEAGRDVEWWFWKMLENIGLDQINDADPFDHDEVQRRLDAVIWRNYQPNGKGGLFPLDRASEDQTQVELWYQLNAYLLEHDYM
jgi:hypothetical protein